MPGKVQGKVAIISGGGSGIGAATAQRFAEEGASVVICGRRSEPLQDVVQAINAEGGVARAFVADVSDPADVEHLISDTITAFGRLDILVNNAMSIAHGMAADTSISRWQKNFSVTVDGTFYMMQAAYPHLKKQRGAIVNLSSILSGFGSKGMTAYSAAKNAVIALTRNVAIEWACDGIRANTVVPGSIMTPPAEAMLADESVLRAVTGAIPLRRIGHPAECANAILFLASDEASYITATTLVVDGGRSVKF